MATATVTATATATATATTMAMATATATSTATTRTMVMAINSSVYTGGAAQISHANTIEDKSHPNLTTHIHNSSGYTGGLPKFQSQMQLVRTHREAPKLS